MKIHFLGASREVTGSCYMLEAQGVRFLVDCGMFQGGREARDKNQGSFTFEPREIDFVLLTHAHIDHSGMLPRLAAQGFKGPIYTTEATVELLQVMLRDSAHIQEKEAEWAQNRNNHHARPGEMEPLYTVVEAEACLTQLEKVSYGEEVRPHPQVRC